MRAPRVIIVAEDPQAALLDPPALGGSPGEAYASHRLRAVGIAKYMASLNPLSAVTGTADENFTTTLIAHAHAASADPGFQLANEERSIDGLPKALRRLNPGNGLVGTEGASTKRDYDMALKGLMALAYRYPAVLGDGGVDFILDSLVPGSLFGGHPASVEIVELTVLNIDVPETENHLLMIESSRYLANQLNGDRTGDAKYDNTALAGWLTGFMQRVLQHDFLEFNARPYGRLQLQPLLNLHEFARDESVRVAAQSLLDYTMVKYALSSNRGRRVTPFRRQQHRINHWANNRNDLYSDAADQISGYFLSYSGLVDAANHPARFPASLHFTGVIAATAAYRPPPAAYELALRHTAPPALHRFHHGIRPRLSSAPEDAEAGVEIYYSSPSFLLTAGGSFLNSGYGHDEIDLPGKNAWEQTSRAQSATLIPTRVDTLFHDLLRCEPYPDPLVDPYLDDPDDPDTIHARAVNMGVHRGLLCGANMRPWPRRAFPQESTDDEVVLAEHKGGVVAGWRGSGADGTPNVAHLIPTSLLGIDGVENLWGKTTLHESSDNAPALASDGTRLFIAWTGSDDRINLAYSTDDGATFVAKTTLTDTSDERPVLCHHDGGVRIAWTGQGGGHLNVAQVIPIGNTAGAVGIEVSDRVTLGGTSDEAPAMASHAGRLFIAWTGEGGGHLNLAFSEDGGKTFTGNATFGDISGRAPALASNNRLFYAWTGTGDNHLNVAPVTLFGNTAGGFGIEGLESKVVLGDTSDEAPTLASANGKLFLGYKGVDDDHPHVVMSSDGTFAPPPWTFSDLTPLGFFLAVYRAPCSAAPDADPPENFGVAYAMEAGTMDFATFQQRTRERNAGLPASFSYGARHDFITADDRHFHFWVSLESQKYTTRVTLDGEPLEPQDFTTLPLADGPYLKAPGGHDGLIEIRYPGCEEHPLILDFRDGARPARTEDKVAGPAAWFERAAAQAALAAVLLQRGQSRDARAALIDAAGIYPDLFGADFTGQTTGFAAAMLPALGGVGVDFSVAASDITEWLGNPEFTGYPALAAALLQLLDARPLTKPVQIDVVSGFYEDVLGAESPRRPAAVRTDVLKAAVLASSNERYGETVGAFEQLLRP